MTDTGMVRQWVWTPVFVNDYFYLFGFVVFLNLQSIANTIGTKTPIGYLIVQNFIFDCSFAAIGFLVVLALHISQWMAASRVNAFEKRVMSRSDC